MILPFELHSPYSIQEGYTNLQKLIIEADKRNIPALALTDTNSLSGAVEFLQGIEKVNKKREQKITPILGITISEPFGKMVVLARNKTGYLQLLKIISKKFDWSNDSCEDLVLILSTEDQISLVSKSFVFINDPFNEMNSGSIPKLKYHPVFYLNKSEAYLQRMLICIKHQCSLKNLKVAPEEERFFDNTKDFSFTTDGDDYEAQSKLLSLIEPYSLALTPQLPIISKDPDAELTDKCRKGWISRKYNLKFKDKENLKNIYVDRIKYELSVLKEANLSNYMLIVEDTIGFAKRAGNSCGLRGSGAGCLVSHLIGVSDVDPVIPDPTLEYSLDRELLFTRFYNKGRNSVGNISLPDCDMDVPISFRDNIIQYLKEKYGPDRVGYIITFSRLDGRGAIKEAFRIIEPVDHSFNIANEITKIMVDTSKVQDILTDIQEENPEYTIIHFNIDNNSEVKRYYEEYKEVFDAAIQLSSTIKNTGRHAAGIVIAPKPLYTFLPVKYDEMTGEQIVSFEMSDLEYAGGVKFDILGVAAYEKIDKICNMINKGLKTI